MTRAITTNRSNPNSHFIYKHYTFSRYWNYPSYIIIDIDKTKVEENLSVRKRYLNNSAETLSSFGKQKKRQDRIASLVAEMTDGRKARFYRCQLFKTSFQTFYSPGVVYSGVGGVTRHSGIVDNACLDSSCCT